MPRFAVALVAFLLCCLPAGATEAGWALLREGGHLVLLRHANPRGGSEQTAGDCAGRRALSERGRQQAREIGALLAARAAPIGRVLSSPSCPSVETATIAFENAPETVAALGPVGADAEASRAQVTAALTTLRDLDHADGVIAVLDLGLITALTGLAPREGEAVIVEPEAQGLRVLGRVIFN